MWGEAASTAASTAAGATAADVGAGARPDADAVYGRRGASARARAALTLANDLPITVILPDALSIVTTSPA